MKLKTIFVFVIAFAGLQFSSQAKTCDGLFQKTLTLPKGPTGPEHGVFNQTIPWLADQRSTPLQQHIWMNIAAPGRATNQVNLDLARRGLIMPNGGLCASTCGVNIVQAIRSYYRVFSRFPSLNDEVHYVVNYSFMRFGHDARFGLAFPMLADAMNHLIQMHGLQYYVRVTSLSWTPQTTPLHQLFPNFGNSVPVLGVKGLNQRNQESMYHAMVVTSFNGKTGQVTLMDPNNPWQPIHAQVYKAHGMQNHWAIRIDHGAYNLPYYYINDVLNITSFY